MVVDLPVEERDEIYQGGSSGEAVVSELGPVEFAFHSMVDLGRYEDGSFDLVYSGQSIEHVTEAQGEQVVTRGVPRPVARWVVLPRHAQRARLAAAVGRADEPRPQDRVQREPAGRALERAGFAVSECKGLNLMQRGAAVGVFDEVEASAHPGVFAVAEDCLLLAVVARKPG